MSEGTEVPIPEAHAKILAANVNGLMSTIRHRDGLISTNPVSYVWDGECVRVSTDDLNPPGTERVTVRIHPRQSSSPLLYGGRFSRE